LVIVSIGQAQRNEFYVYGRPH